VMSWNAYSLVTKTSHIGLLARDDRPDIASSKTASNAFELSSLYHYLDIGSSPTLRDGSRSDLSPDSRRLSLRGLDTAVSQRDRRSAMISVTPDAGAATLNMTELLRFAQVRCGSCGRALRMPANVVFASVYP
jgi:hypothetical protein